MRIVGGKHKGRPIAPPKGRDTRPTADRAREAIFNVLAHGIDGPGLDGARVVDVFAGTGALGLEALSRGAAHATFVDNQRQALAVLRENIRTLGEDRTTTIIDRRAEAIGPAKEPVDFAFLDAPYDTDLSAPALDALARGGWLRDGAIVMVEIGARETLSPPPGFTLEKEKTYGAARVVFFTYHP